MYDLQLLADFAEVLQVRLLYEIHPLSILL